MKQRIDFIVGGIQKCGTTTLYGLLRQHPSLIGSAPKEPHFFSRRGNSQLTEEQYKVTLPIRDGVPEHEADTN